MNTERDATRIVRSWLRSDEHESADRVLDNVLALLDTTPQRRSRWPARRIADMNTFAKLAIAAAAVVVVAVVGFTLLPAREGAVGIPAVTPSPTPSASATASPSAALSVPFPPTGELAIGRHPITRHGVTLTVDLTTSGWRSDGTFAFDKGQVSSPDGAGFLFWTDTPDGVYTDPCGSVMGPKIGESPADLAAAVSTVPGLQLVSGPRDVMVGGHPAKHVVVFVPEDAACGAGGASFYLWWEESIGGRWATALGSTINVWIIDVDGQLVWIDGETFKDSSPAVVREIEQIVDSIRFE